MSNCLQHSIVPDNVPRLKDIPANATLIAIAPYLSMECASLIVAQSYMDSARLVIFANDSLLSNHLLMTGSSPVSILGVSTVTGQNAFAHMAEFSSNGSVSVPGMSIDNAIARVGIQVQSQLSSGLPKLWVFVLAVLAGVIVLIVLISLMLNLALYLRRRNLRRRILAGEVNLELLGVKRLTVPQEILDKIPVRIYTHGEQHFHNDNTSIAASSDSKSKSWKSKILNNGNTAVKGELGPSKGQGSTGYSQTNCPICLEDFENNVTQVRELPCDHIYHLECIDSFLKTRSSLCPLCKKSTLPPGYLPATLKLTNATVRREREMRQRVRSRRRGAVQDLERNGNHGPAATETTHRSLSRVQEEVTDNNNINNNQELTDDLSNAQGNQTSTTTNNDNDTNNNSGALMSTPNQANVEVPPRGLEAMALTEEEEAAEHRRRPGWRRALHSVFPV